MLRHFDSLFNKVFFLSLEHHNTILQNLVFVFKPCQLFVFLLQLLVLLLKTVNLFLQSSILRFVACDEATLLQVFLILSIEHKALHNFIAICQLSLHLSNPCLLFVYFVEVFMTLLLHSLQFVIKVLGFNVYRQKLRHKQIYI